MTGNNDTDIIKQQGAADAAGNGTQSAGSRRMRRRRHALLAGVAAVALLVGAGMSYAGMSYHQAATPVMPQQTAEQSTPAQSAQAAPGFAELVRKVKPAVVSVHVEMRPTAQDAAVDNDMNPFKGTPFERFFRDFHGRNGEEPDRQVPGAIMQALGSGFIVSPDGCIVTNNHVVQNAVKVQVVMDDGTQLDAKVIGTDPKSDLALVKVDDHGNLPFVKLANSPPRVGDWVVAVGNPFGLGGTVTAGIVSAEGRDIGDGPYDDFIQIDAPVNKGNSGGPTFNMTGEVVGVNTAIYSPSGGSVGVAFDIPASTVQNVVAQLKERGQVVRGWLGVQIQPVTAEIADSLGLKEAKGALISEPEASGPAAKAGLQSGDVILRVNGTEIRASRDLARMIGAMAPNASVSLTIMRDGQQRSVDLRLAQMQEDHARAAPAPGKPSDGLGLQVAPAAQIEGAGKQGLAVLGITPNGKAAEAGVREGDIILKAAGKAVSTADDVKKAMTEAKQAGRKHALLLLKREAAELFIAVPV